MFKAPPVPKFDEPFHPVLPHRHTEPQPFSFEERMKESIAKKEKTFQTVLEEEAKVCIPTIVHNYISTLLKR